MKPNTSPENSRPDNNSNSNLNPNSSLNLASNQNHLTSQIKSTKKNFWQQWWFWTMAALGLMAVVGVSIGAYGLDRENQALARETELQQQLEEANQLLVKYGTRLGLKVNEHGRPADSDWETKLDETTQAPDLAKSDEDHIYLGQWGIKIRIPQGLKNVSYAYQAADGDHATPKVCFWAVPEAATYIPEFAQYQINVNGMGCIARFRKGENKGINGGTIVYTANDYDYQFYPALGAYTQESGEELAWEEEAVNSLRSMLTRMINYSEF